MYSPWIFAAAGILAIGLFFRKLLTRRRKRVLSPFQKRPGAVTLPPADSEALAQSRTQAGLLRVAGDEGLLPASVHSDRTASIPAPNTNFAAAAGSASWSDSENHLTSTATIPISSGHGINRLSTWNDRRLFSDFRGILNETADSIPLPSPEELPIRNEDFIFGSLTPSIAQLLPETDARRESQRKELVSAGYHSRAAWLNLASVRFVLAFLALVVVGFWLIVAPAAMEPWLLGLLIMAPLFMWALPPLVVSFKASERKLDIERGLPDVLDMMNMGISQGLTVPQSLKRISREISEIHPALAEELRIVDQQSEVGNLPQALRNLGQRIESPEVYSFTSLLVQSEATGTSISKSLTEYSDSIRSSLKERADARANAASFKLLFPVALMLMPSVFLFLLGPAIVQMTDFFNNQGQQLQRDRQNAMQSLEQQPQLDLQRFAAPDGALGGQ